MVKTVVRHARVGATPALPRDTPWPSRESPYLHRGHNPCRFTTVWPGGLTVEIRFVPEELRRCLGISRRCFTARCAQVSRGCFKVFETPGPLPGERRFITVYPDSMRCLPASLRCGPETVLTRPNPTEVVHGHFSSRALPKTLYFFSFFSTLFLHPHPPLTKSTAPVRSNPDSAS